MVPTQVGVGVGVHSDAVWTLLPRHGLVVSWSAGRSWRPHSPSPPGHCHATFGIKGEAALIRSRRVQTPECRSTLGFALESMTFLLPGPSSAGAG